VSLQLKIIAMLWNCDPTEHSTSWSSWNGPMYLLKFTQNMSLMWALRWAQLLSLMEWLTNLFLKGLLGPMKLLLIRNPTEIKQDILNH